MSAAYERDGPAAPLRPVLVTGAHRSGTTWIGRILAMDPRLAYLDEPFNPDYRPRATGRPLPHPYLFVHDGNEATYARAVDGAMALRYPVGPQIREMWRPGAAVALAQRVTSARSARRKALVPLMKDPLAFFSTAWLARRYDMRVVVCVRHPAGFASSVLRLGWHFDFTHWVDQPALMAHHLQPWADEIRDAARRPPPLLDQAVLLWRAIYGVASRMREEHPDWLFVRQIDVTGSPVDAFAELYRRLDLHFTPAIRARVQDLTGAHNATEVAPGVVHEISRHSAQAGASWRSRLDADQIDRIRRGTEREAGAFYADCHWRA